MFQWVTVQKGPWKNSCSKSFVNFVLNSRRYFRKCFDYILCCIAQNRHIFANIAANSKFFSWILAKRGLIDEKNESRKSRDTVSFRLTAHSTNMLIFSLQKLIWIAKMLMLMKNPLLISSLIRTNYVVGISKFYNDLKLMLKERQWIKQMHIINLNYIVLCIVQGIKFFKLFFFSQWSNETGVCLGCISNVTAIIKLATILSAIFLCYHIIVCILNYILN
jgi:hypothetical protein